jgi:DNA-binding NarL/FixJ family response regulator
VVVLDAHPLGDALALCLQIKAGLARPRVVLFASEVRTAAIVPARLAGADGIVDKTADVRELLHAIRAAAGGESALPRITPRLQTDAACGSRRRTARSSRCAWPAPRRPTSRRRWASTPAASRRAPPRSSKRSRAQS